MASKTSGPSKKAQYAAYASQNRYAANRKRKLLKTLKAQPNNLQVVEALKNIKYRRSIPATAMWSSTKRKVACLFKQFTGLMNNDVFSNNPVTKTQATNKLRGSAVVITGKVTNKLGDRAHDKLGNLVWK